MADLIKKFTIPGALIPEMIEVFGKNYETTIPDPTDETVMIPNPTTKAQFASQIFDLEIKKYVQRRVVEYRKSKTLETLNGDFTIT